MSYGSNDTFGNLLVHSVQKLWSLIGAGARGQITITLMHFVHVFTLQVTWQLLW